MSAPFIPFPRNTYDIREPKVSRIVLYYNQLADLVSDLNSVQVSERWEKMSTEEKTK